MSQSDISWQRQMGDGTWGWSVCGLLADISRIKPPNTKELEKKLRIILTFGARYKLFILS